VCVSIKNIIHVYGALYSYPNLPMLLLKNIMRNKKIVIWEGDGTTTPTISETHNNIGKYMSTHTHIIINPNMSEQKLH